MKSLPIYSSRKPGGLVYQVDRWFAWNQALAAFGSLLNQRHYMPMIGQQTTRTGLSMSVNGTAAGIMDGPVNAIDVPGDAASYLEVPTTEPLLPELDCSYPVVAFWFKKDSNVGVIGSLAARTATAGSATWAALLDAAGSFAVRIYTDGTNFTDCAPGDPADMSKWNFYAFQHRSATETNVLVNDTLTVFNTTYATAFTPSTSPYRIGRNIDGQIALVSLANDNSANTVQKLLGLYYHSRYAFRDDWT